MTRTGCLWTTCLLALALGGPCAAQEADASCGPIVGTYARKQAFTLDDTLEVKRQGSAYWFRLNASWANRPNDGSQTHTGTSEGRIAVGNCRAQFDDPENECRLTFVFKGKKTVRIQQENSCVMFGANVDATGEYTKK